MLTLSDRVLSGGLPMHANKKVIVEMSDLQIADSHFLIEPDHSKTTRDFKRTQSG